MMDKDFMAIALEEAKQAFQENEIPVGACLVRDGEVVIRDHNRTKELQNPLAHAEKLILDKAQEMGLKYLQDYTLYVSLEPCAMCAGSIILSRVGRVVFGCGDPKSGAAGGVFNLLQDANLNHNPQLKRGVLEEDCALLLTEFFRNKR